MAKLDRSKDFGVVYGSECGCKYVQDGKSFNSRGIEVNGDGKIVDPNDLLPEVVLSRAEPIPINNRVPHFDKSWEKDRDPPSEYVGLAHDGWKNPEPEQESEPDPACVCGKCGKECKSPFGRQAHERFCKGEK